MELDSIDFQYSMENLPVKIIVDKIFSKTGCENLFED
jgi:hypothetical protein